MNAKTKIEIDPLFADKWDAAYVVHHKKENRNYVMLRNSKTDKRTTMQYAKYLMCIKLGRPLYDNEQVDHIDGDKTNDSINNLQVLSKEAHERKSLCEKQKREEQARASRVPRHGTYWEHKKYGCNCAACVAAYKEYSCRKTAEHRKRLKDAGIKRTS